MEDGLNRAQRYFFGLELCRTLVLPVLNRQENIRLLSSWAHLGLKAAVSRGSVTAQPPHATLKRVHPSCLAVDCLCCPSFPAAGSTVILVSAALPLPSCS